MRRSFRNLVVAVLICSIISLGAPVVAEARVIGTFAAVESQQRSEDLATISAALARKEVREQFAAMGIDAAQAEKRIAAMTDSELRKMAQQMKDLPAGGDFLAVLGVVFVILLILQVFGVIDIFKKIK
jgi:hypothetical protein